MQFPGDLVYCARRTNNELGAASTIAHGKIGLQFQGRMSNLVWPLYLALHRAIQQGLVCSAIRGKRGTWGRLDLAMVAMAASWMAIPGSDEVNPESLYPRRSAEGVLSPTDPADRAETPLPSMPAACIGEVTEAHRFKGQSVKRGTDH